MAPPRQVRFTRLCNTFLKNMLKSKASGAFAPDPMGKLIKRSLIPLSEGTPSSGRMANQKVSTPPFALLHTIIYSQSNDGSDPLTSTLISVFPVNSNCFKSEQYKGTCVLQRCALVHSDCQFLYYTVILKLPPHILCGCQCRIAPNYDIIIVK